MTLGNVHLTPQLIQAVRDAADIVAIASDHTRLRKAGRRYQGLCPLHKERTPSFSVDPVQGLFYCFGCGAGGDAIKLHMLTTGDAFPEAIEALARQHGIPLPSRTERAAGRPERDLEGALEKAAEFFTAQLSSSPFARDYLDRRQVAPELAQRFRLGYAPDSWRALLGALHPRVPLSDLEAAGLVGRSERSGEPYDRFRHRLVFPILNSAGRLVGFGGRTLGDDKAKYINTSETDRFHKGDLLYGLYQGKREVRECGRVVLVEGYFDVLGVVASGREGAVAGMGTALTPEQARQLSRYAEEVVVAYDGDAAGESAFRRALPLLLAEGLGVRRAVFPGGHDPDSLRLAEGPSAVLAALDGAGDAVALELDRLVPVGTVRDPRAQAKAATAVSELLLPIADPVLRFAYERVAAERLDLPVEMLGRRARPAAAGQRAAPRGGGENRGGSQAPVPAPGQGRRDAAKVVRTLEEEVLRRLLLGEEPLPPPAQLPAADVFFDMECRNIYLAFCTLYTEKGPEEARGGPGMTPQAPAIQKVRDAVAVQGGPVDRMASILLEEPAAPARSGLPESLQSLQRRWQERRLRELVSEIAAAQRRGDEVRLDSLIQEKTRLSHDLHRPSRHGPPSLRARGEGSEGG